MKNKKRRWKVTIVLTVLSLILQCMSVGAAEEGEDAQALEQLPSGPDWALDASTAPEVVADSAILMDIDTGVILYEKNIHKRQYPASITKLLTCLLAAENSELTDIVTFSHEAVYGIERGSSNIGIDEGEQLTMEECLYAALLESANEVSSGIAEHVGGSIEGFTEMMNAKVRELGGSDSNFVNANGLHDDNHYTSAYDMALIGQAFAKNQMLLEMSATVYYHIDATPEQPDAIDLRHKHRMLPECQRSGKKPYEYTTGGKNGYTDTARQTLVTFAKKDGHRLVCVVLKDEKPKHYEDSIALFNYGFACYDNPALRAQIDAKAKELGAAEEEETPAEEEEKPAGEDGERLTQKEMDERVDGLTDRKEESTDQAESGGNEKKDREKSGGFPVLTVSVIAVSLGAVAVCGFIFYQSYRKEQERRRRQAEIMARHRARKQQGDRP
ncbi:MAG: D-alanyl-D-alanine carboxypeptidase [Lachnospiraceae bacterium]|jgi:D-alanyl-D-alanine carboxypeptidase|nr:D-alanyl-D-alanine carboxypeptidase [Lachnospiraceae bacterium]